MKKNLVQFMRVGLVALTICGGKVALAGERGGNGGDALVCPDKVMLLDHFEAIKNDLTVNVEGSTLEEKVKGLIARFGRLDQPTAKVLEASAMEMVNDIVKKQEDPSYRTKVIKFSNNIVLTDIDDSLELALPKGCEKKQLVIQKTPVFAEDRLYEIDKDLWDRMDLDDQAMTITHEAWYKYYIRAGALDSRFARHLNGLFASEESESLLLADYLTKIALASKISTFVTPTPKMPLSIEILGKNFGLLPEEKFSRESDTLKMKGAAYVSANLRGANFKYIYANAVLKQDAQLVSYVLEGELDGPLRFSNLLVERSWSYSGKCEIRGLSVDSDPTFSCKVERAIYNRKMYTGFSMLTFKVDENKMVYDVTFSKL